MEKILKAIKEHKVPLIAGGLIVLLLAAAFWYGSGTPDSRGFSAKQETEADGQKAKDKKAGKIPEDLDAAAMDKVTGEAVSAASGEAAEALASQEQASGMQENSTNKNESSGGNAEKTGAGSQKKDSDKGQESSQASRQPDSSQSVVPAGEKAADTNAMVISPGTGKDKYQTEPVPEGKPEPVEPEDTEPGKKKYSCTISISCATILDNMNLLNKNKTGLIPKDGWILKPVTVSFQEGESVFDVLQRVCKDNKIHMEFSNTPMYNSAYIEGIHNIYEFDAGSLSGWNYKVNDWFPNYGCSRYRLKDGDVICWMYTCDLGRDVGGSNTISP